MTAPRGRSEDPDRELRSEPPAPDLRSYAERFAGTEWATPSPAPPPALAPRTLRWWIPVIVVAGLGAIGVVFAAGLVAIPDDILDSPMTDPMLLVMLVVLPWLAGGVSALIVPGEAARGRVTSAIVGLIGWGVSTNAAVLITNGQFPASIGYVRGLPDQVICALLGASILRLLLRLVG